jgi:hypothetical protein
MSQENVRLVERAIAAINARDIEGYRACCTENVKLETPMAAVGGVYEGIAGIRRPDGHRGYCTRFPDRA